MLASLVLHLLAIGADVAEPPRTVTLGIYVHQINAVNLRDNSFTADFNVWFRWKGDGPDPLKSFELSNGKVDLQEKGFRSSVGDEHYATCRVIATFTQFWNLSAFPLDDHILELAIEDQLEDHLLRYIADAENSALNPKARVPGWTLGKPIVAIATNVYSTNYGDTSLPTGHESTYSRFVFEIPMKRPGYGYCLKLFVGLLVATMLAFATFFVEPDNDSRLSLGVGAVFAAVASEYIVAACLPATNVLTLADALHILALATIFTAIAESIAALRLLRAGRTALAHQLDRWTFRFLGAAFVVSCVVLFFHFCGDTRPPSGSPRVTRASGDRSAMSISPYQAEVCCGAAKVRAKPLA